MSIPKSLKLQSEEVASAPEQIDSNGPLKNFSTCDTKPVKCCSPDDRAEKVSNLLKWKPLNGLVIVKCEPVEESIIITNVNNAPAFKLEGVVLSIASDVLNVEPGEYVKFGKSGIVSDSVDPTDSSVILLNHKSILCSRV